MKRKAAFRIPFLTGVVLGICASLLLIVLAFVVGMGSPPDSAFLPNSSAHPTTPQFSPVTTQFSPETQTALGKSATAIILGQARQLLNNGQPEQVAGLLEPAMEDWTSRDDLAEGNKILGQAEMDLGHPKLAAAYFENLFIYQPTADHLFLIAMAYDAGGENRKALEKYLLLAGLDSTEGQFDRDYVHRRIQNLSWILGPRTPQP